MDKLKTASTFIMAILIVGIIASTTSATSVAASSSEERVNVGDVFTIVSERGVAIAAEDGNIVKKNASLKMSIEVTEVEEHGFKFVVKSGAIEIEGKEFALTNGEGGVKARRYLRGAFLGVKGYVQNGEVRLGGTIVVRYEKAVVWLKGPFSVGDTLCWLRFFAVHSKA
ncbi:MAG: hypothetical protein QW265_00170 [Candidatus Bathyarchaeia archaeon]